MSKVSRRTIVIALLSILYVVGQGMFRIGDELKHSHWTAGFVVLLTSVMVASGLLGYVLGRKDAGETP